MTKGLNITAIAAPVDRRLPKVSGPHYLEAIRG
jgi:hypothetical protein